MKAAALSALRDGATSRALEILIQMTGDADFIAQANAYLRPADTGEAWRRAYRISARFYQMLHGGDIDTALSELANSLSALDTDCKPEGQPLARAVYDIANMRLREGRNNG